MIGAEDLAQEDPQYHQRRVDAVEPDDVDCCQCLRDDPFRENICERQIAVLQKLTPQETRLSLKPPIVS
jgi:hypothetical protein